MAAVEAKVTEDYRKSQAQEMARTAGMSFVRSVTNSLAQGKTFKAAASEAKLEPVELPKFSLGTRELEKFEDRVSLPMIKDSVSRMTAGSASNFIPTREGGMVVYLKARIPASEQKLKDEFPAFLEEVRESRESSAFGEWFSQQVNAAGLNTPPANSRGGR